MMSSEDPKMDGEAMKLEATVMDKEYRDKLMAEAEFREKVPRQFDITKDNPQQFGYTRGCPGCKAVLRKTSSQARSGACRKRMGEEMKDEPKVKAANQKINEYLEKILEKEVLTGAGAAGSLGEHGRKRGEAGADAAGRSTRRRLDNGDDIADCPKHAGEEMDVDVTAVEDTKHGQLGRDQGGRTQRGEGPDQLLGLGPLEHRRGRREHREQQAEQGRGPDDPPGGAGNNGEEDEDGADSESSDEGREIYGMAVNEEIEVDMAELPMSGDDASSPGHIPMSNMDPRLVEEARSDEVDFMHKIVMFDYVNVSECWERTGAAPTSTRWVDVVKKNDAGELTVRCRLVGRDFKPKGDRDREDLFAAMPPLEAKRMLFRMAAGMRSIRREQRLPEMKLMFIDVRKAHLNAECHDDVYVDLPVEFGQPGRCGKLRRWLYGMRKAGQAWEDHYADKLEAIGFARGIAAPTVFYNKETKVRVVVHGDDFTFLGEKKELEVVRQQMENWYEIKFRGIMGSSSDDLKEVTILGRRLRWLNDQLEYEADEGHRTELLRATGLTENSNSRVAPAMKSQDDEKEEALLDDCTRYRAAAARLNYYGQDRIDIQFAAKEVCKEMSTPTEGGLRKLKQVCRYLVSAKRLVWTMGTFEEEVLWIDVFVDSDWAGDRSGRKSTSGGVLSIGGVAVKSWSRTQRSRATSVGEAEYYAAVGGAAEALGSLAKDLGWTLKVRLWTDSSAAKSIGSRRGLGKTRHIETKFLWLQQAVRKGRVFLKKIPGKLNPAHVLTKPLARWEFEDNVKTVGGEIR